MKPQNRKLGVVPVTPWEPVVALMCRQLKADRDVVMAAVVQDGHALPIRSVWDSEMFPKPCQLVIQSTNRSRINGFYIRTPYESNIYNARMGNAAQKRFSNSFQ